MTRATLQINLFYSDIETVVLVQYSGVLQPFPMTNMSSVKQMEYCQNGCSV